ncbi:MAG: hypothetical protein HY513_04390 [Candidatus Aenigmarchaeota archaeon]|nr:hypothetical protein [Candidatus Aenigmarchaeota archaeon]
MNKILGIIFIVLGIIAVAGSIVYFVSLSVLGQVISAAGTDPAIAQQAGVDAQSFSDVLGTLSALLALAWLWGIAVLASGLGSLWFGIRILRRKSK